LKSKTIKPNKNSYDNLEPEQKEYIRNKCIELGSLEAVEEFYRGVGALNKKDLVSRYARKIAKKLYNRR
jgi:hypothetical protein